MKKQKKWKNIEFSWVHYKSMKKQWKALRNIWKSRKDPRKSMKIHDTQMASNKTPNKTLQGFENKPLYKKPVVTLSVKNSKGDHRFYRHDPKQPKEKSYFLSSLPPKPKGNHMFYHRGHKTKGQLLFFKLLLAIMRMVFWGVLGMG